jgi:ribosome modulation factor
MPANGLKGIAEYAEKFKETQAARDAVVNKGRLAYRMGIELRNCPEKDLSKRNLWEIGWKAAAADFDALLKRNDGTMR